MATFRFAKLFLIFVPQGDLKKPKDNLIDGMQKLENKFHQSCDFHDSIKKY
jgi:hypothetical protein